MLGLLLENIVLGFLLLFFGIFFKVFPPKKINSLYGYRTSSSKKNMETWKEANRYSANFSIIIAVLSILIGAVSYFLFEEENSVTITVITTVVLLILIVPFTESHLKKRFDK